MGGRKSNQSDLMTEVRDIEDVELDQTLESKMNDDLHGLMTWEMCGEDGLGI